MREFEGIHKRLCEFEEIEISRQAVDVNSKEENSSLRQINLKQAGIDDPKL